VTRASRRRERGVALLLVLWVFMILGVLALDFARYMRDDAMAAVNFAEETRGYYVALAGMNRALYEIEVGRDDADAGGTAADEDDDDGDLAAGGGAFPVDGEWHEGTLGEGRFAVRVADEGGRISLRKPNEALVKHVVTTLIAGGNAVSGMSRQTAGTIDVVTDSILDWIDANDQVRTQGAEDAYYRSRRVPYGAKNGWLESPEELLLVRGVTAALFHGGDGLPGLRDVFSVYNESQQVNLRTVTAPVLQALLALDAEAAAELLAQREEDAEGFKAAVTVQLGNANPVLGQLAVFADAEPSVVTVDATADLGAERNRARVAAVIDLESQAAEGVRVLRWLDRAPWDGSVPGDGGTAEAEAP
jgi:general secretion pathway protein K